MINFFRKTRKKLVDNNQPTSPTGRFLKYSRYAIGEIVLVMLGILLALQVNNWNEKRIESRLEKEYLIGIKNDLKQDFNQASIIVSSNITRLNIIHMLDSNFRLNSEYKSHIIDTMRLGFNELFYRGESFRSTKGNYSSLIADGRSNLIKNRILFQKIQSLYDVEYLRIYSIYGDFKLRETNLASKYSYEKFNWDYNDLLNEESERMISDIANFWETAQFYCVFLDESKLKMESIITKIDEEIKK